MTHRETQPEQEVLLKYARGVADAGETASVEKWLSEDPDNMAVLENTARIWHAWDTRRRIAGRDTDKALSKVHKRIGRNRRRTVALRLMAAASFVIGVMGIGLSAYVLTSGKSEPEMIVMSTNPGMRSSVTLPDGTKVCLNAGSRIEYPSFYPGNERRVVLEGEAYFDVARDEDKPFVVAAADGRVKVQVLGTRFNLSAYADDGFVQTTLIEGSVRLDLEGRDGGILMQPDDKVTYSLADGKVYREKCRTDCVTSWIDGRFIFRDTPLPQVLQQLSHFYSVDFKVMDRRIDGYTFTGVFRDASLFQIMDYLKMTSKMEYDIENTESQMVITIR